MSSDSSRTVTRSPKGPWGVPSLRGRTVCQQRRPYDHAMDPNDIAYLAGQIEQGNVILFTGAGFSLGAHAEDGQSIPSAGQLLRELWPLVYGGANYDGSTLADVYGAAARLHGNATRELLSRRLKVSRENLPDPYRLSLSFPWHRIHAVNIDNLEDVVQV